MIIDANILLYARHRGALDHDEIEAWLTDALNGHRRIGLPWQSLQAFVRIATNSAVFAAPLTTEDAADQIQEWLAAPAAWIPEPSARYAELFDRLVRRHRVTGALTADAALAALAWDHGVEIVSTDGDFARFDEIAWLHPLR